MPNDSSLKSAGTPSSNWLALQKKVSKTARSGAATSAFAARKRRKLGHASEPVSTLAYPINSPQAPAEAHTFPRGTLAGEPSALHVDDGEVKNGESLAQLRRMTFGEIEHTVSQKQPGKYLALDCEMVGVGLDGSESALARVSIVNYHGYVLIDVFVRQRERVVDYRTEFSGIRPSDMVHARPFEEVQKEVADLLKDRILVGHAVHNDLKALLLSHPRPQTRDTQILAYKHKVSRGRRPALRHLVKQELGLTIQGGEHSSVTDARATMALFRLHRKTWETNVRPIAATRSKSPAPSTSSPAPSAKPSKRPRSTSPTDGVDDDASNEDKDESVVSRAVSTSAKKKGKTKAAKTFPGGGRRGVSSGLSTVIKRGVAEKGSRAQTKVKAKTKEKWWKELGGGGGSKGSVRLKVG
ncbi:ribonuclease H-like domain-containing protein [Earliella scabrosa]|nr:ribonuclease H-like domain-containing protein [Earliella scabrosa]